MCRTNCGEHNFASRAECFRCGGPRAADIGKLSNDMQDKDRELVLVDWSALTRCKVNLCYDCFSGWWIWWLNPECASCISPVAKMQGYYLEHKDLPHVSLQILLFEQHCGKLSEDIKLGGDAVGRRGQPQVFAVLSKGQTGLMLSF